MVVKKGHKHTLVESSFNCDASNPLLQQSGALRTVQVTIPTKLAGKLFPQIFISTLHKSSLITICF